MLLQLVRLVLMTAVQVPVEIGEDGVGLADRYQLNWRCQWQLASIYFWSIHITSSRPPTRPAPCPCAPGRLRNSDPHYLLADISE